MPSEPGGRIGGFTIIGTRTSRFGGPESQPIATAATGPDLATTDNRLQSMNRWIESLADRFGLVPASVAPASNDASFRRYFRIEAAQGSCIIMEIGRAHV